jgi:hypothetical protein
MGWEVDPTRGGIRANSGDPDYVQHVLRAESGLSLTPPPAPKPKTKATTEPNPKRKRRRKH